MPEEVADGWTLHVNPETCRPLVILASHSYLRIRFEPTTEAGVPTLRGPTQTVTGRMQVIAFLNRRQCRH